MMIINVIKKPIAEKTVGFLYFTGIEETGE